MFAFDRSALAVLAPLALLVAVAWWTNRSAATPPALAERAEDSMETVAATDQTVAANLPSR